MGPHYAGRRSGRAALLLSFGAATMLALGPATTDAATVSNAWRAKVGSAGANGLATIQAYTTGSGAIVLKLAKLKPSTYLPVALYKGTCGSVGAVLIKFPSIKTTSGGAAARTSSLSAGQVNSIKAATKGTGKIAIRVGSSSTGLKCGLFAALAVPPPPAAVAAKITVGVDPAGVAVTPIGVLVANWYDGTLSRVDPATNSVLAALPLTVTGNEGPQAVTYGEGAVWVTMYAFDSAGDNVIAGSVERVDPTTGQVIATIPVGKGPIDITTSPGAVWVANYDEDTVTRIDPATNQVAASIKVGAWPSGVSFGFGALWATSEQAGTVSRIDPSTNQVVATIATIGGPEGVTTGAGSVWVANWGTTGQPDGVLSRIDPATNQVVRTIPIGTNPVFVSFAGGYAWVALRGESTVVQVNATTNAVQAKISSGLLVLDASAKVVGLWGIAATDHAVWAVQPIPVSESSPGSVYAVPGTLVRINY